MSHAKIYQVGKKPISRDNYVEPEDFYDNHDSYADWVGDNVEADERKECVDYLAKELQEIFEQDGESLIFKGKPVLRKFKQKWVEAIHAAAQEVTVDNVNCHTSRQNVRCMVNDTHLFFDGRVCIEEWSGKYASPLAELIDYADVNLWKGQRLYIGAVIDYHY